MALPKRILAASAVAATLTLLASACTGSTKGSAEDDPSDEVTITFWHGWSADSEVKAIQDNVDAFEKEYPNIHVKVVGNITDDKINQALRAGGDKAPDAVSSFTTDNVGKFCTSNVFVDLAPFLEKSKIDPEDDLPQAASRLHAVRGRTVHAAVAQRRLRSLLQQGRLQGGRHQEPAQDALGVRGRRPQADEGEGRHLLAARVHADLPRLRDHDDALRLPVEPDVLRRRRQVDGGHRSGVPRDAQLAEGPCRRARRLRQAREVPDDLR